MLSLNITLSNFLETFEAEIIILPQVTEAEMKNGVASENKNVYLNINIFILTIALTRHQLCHSGQCCHYIETSPLIDRATQWDGFYTIATLD